MNIRTLDVEPEDIDEHEQDLFGKVGVIGAVFSDPKYKSVHYKLQTLLMIAAENIVWSK